MSGFFFATEKSTNEVIGAIDSFHFPNQWLHHEKNVTLLFISQSKKVLDWNSARTIHPVPHHLSGFEKLKIVGSVVIWGALHIQLLVAMRLLFCNKFVVLNRAIISLSVLLFSWAWSTSSLAQQQRYMIDKVVAKVGSEFILMSEIEDEYSYLKTTQPTAPITAKCEILESAISQKLIVYQAKLDSVEVKDDEVESQLQLRFDAVLRQMNGDEQFFKEYYGATVNEMKERYRDDQRQKILAERMQYKLIDEVSITPSEVAEFFAQIPKDSIPYLNAEVEIGEIVIKPTINEDEKRRAKNKLEDIRVRIVEGGESFSDLAIKYSMDPGSGKKGGDLGFAKRGSYVPEFESAAYNLAPGEISDLVETEFGFHIIQMDERRGNSIKLKHILISPQITDADQKLAYAKLDSIRSLIVSDSMSFESAVKRFSLKTMPSYTNNGRVRNQANGTNFFETSELDPDTYFAIDEMKLNDISKVMELKGPTGEKMYRLVKLFSRTKPHKASLELDYDKISYYAKESKKSQYLNTWIMEKMNETFIEVDPIFNFCPTLEKWVKKEK